MGFLAAVTHLLFIYQLSLVTEVVIVIVLWTGLIFLSNERHLPLCDTPCNVHNKKYDSILITNNAKLARTVGLWWYIHNNAWITYTTLILYYLYAHYKTNSAAVFLNPCSCFWIPIIRRFMILRNVYLTCSSPIAKNLELPFSNFVMYFMDYCQ